MKITPKNNGEISHKNSKNSIDNTPKKKNSITNIKKIEYEKFINNNGDMSREIINDLNLNNNNNNKMQQQPIDRTKIINYNFNSQNPSNDEENIDEEIPEDSIVNKVNYSIKNINNFNKSINPKSNIPIKNNNNNNNNIFSYNELNKKTQKPIRGKYSINANGIFLEDNVNNNNNDIAKMNQIQTMVKKPKKKVKKTYQSVNKIFFLIINKDILK